MSGPDRLADAVIQLFREPQPKIARFFFVHAVDPGRHLVTLVGGGAEPFAVDRKMWCSAFTAAVEAGTAAGRPALVVVVDGQVVIVDVLG